MLALIESPVALLGLSGVVTAPSLQALITGGDDLASALSLCRGEGSRELMVARQLVVLHGRGSGLQCVDVVRIDLEDEEGLRREAREGWEWGYSGKQLVHPQQVRLVQEEMVGGMERLRWCERLVSSWKDMEGKGVGAWRMDGKMIDGPTVRNALRVLQHARACGLTVDM